MCSSQYKECSICNKEIKKLGPSKVWNLNLDSFLIRNLFWGEIGNHSKPTTTVLHLQKHFFFLNKHQNYDIGYEWCTNCYLGHVPTVIKISDHQHQKPKSYPFRLAFWVLLLHLTLSKTIISVTPPSIMLFSFFFFSFWMVIIFFRPREQVKESKKRRTTYIYASQDKWAKQRKKSQTDQNWGTPYLGETPKKLKQKREKIHTKLNIYHIFFYPCPPCL